MKKNLSMERIRKSCFCLVLACTLCAAMAPRAFAEESWKEAFDDVCGKVQFAENLTTQEIAALIEKADKILPEIEKSDDPGKKIFIMRLKKCRALYEFMIESRKSAESTGKSTESAGQQ